MGERNLDVLLATLDVVRRPGTFTMVSAPAGTSPPADAAAWIAEDDGVTFVVPATDGDGDTFIAAWLTLTVHSDLAAVGLTAAVATALADAGIAANVLAAFHHDHVLVPADRAEDAIHALRALAQGR